MPRRLVLRTASQFSSGMECSGPPNPPIPALLTRMSRRLKVCWTRWARAATEFQSDTSQTSDLHEISFAVCCSRDRFRPQITVVPPIVASWRAIAAPMPWPPPVTSATLFERLCSIKKPVFVLFWPGILIKDYLKVRFVGRRCQIMQAEVCTEAISDQNQLAKVTVSRDLASEYQDNHYGVLSN